jgi:hypothetical protein
MVQRGSFQCHNRYDFNGHSFQRFARESGDDRRLRLRRGSGERTGITGDDEWHRSKLERHADHREGHHWIGIRQCASPAKRSHEQRVPFTISTPHIAGISPTSGSAGTSVTFTGTGFGASQGGGAVWLGSTNGQVSSWSDTQVVATVASGSLTGVARTQQNATWSNAFAFTVPGGTAAALVPHLLNLAVGDTHTIEALGSNGQSVTGLAWTSSDPTVVSLSTDDPPILTALAAGHVTVSPGAASADVTVQAGVLAPGTVLWSNLGDGSGVSKIIPAVPSPTGVADVFALQNDGTIQAITSDGVTAWTATVSGATSATTFFHYPTILPDFQGGVLVLTPSRNPGSITRLDGITGQPSFMFTLPNTGAPVPSAVGSAAVHQDGTIFAQVGINESSSAQDNINEFVIGIDPATGAQRFSIPLPTMPLNGVQRNAVNQVTSIMVAGDGFAYIAYDYTDSSNPAGRHLNVMRIDTSGNYTTIDLFDDVPAYPANPLPMFQYSYPLAALISSGGDGVYLSWRYGPFNQPHWTKISSAGVTDGSGPLIPGMDYAITPMVQRQDGSFVGLAVAGSDNATPYMVAYDATGNVLWSVANDQPQIATADNGVIGASGTVYDQNGSGVTLANVPTQSWRGNTYQIGSVDQVVSPSLLVALTLWAQVGGNPSGNSTAARPSYFKLVWQNDCSSGVQPCGFFVYPANPQVLPNLLVDATSQATMVKTAALNSLKRAFDKYNIDVSEGQPATGNHQAVVINGTIVVNGLPACGLTLGSRTNTSNVAYALHMELAQDAVPITLTSAQDAQNALANRVYMQSIGTGIGNTAAHEIGHQFFGNGSGMEDSSTNTYNGALGCDPVGGGSGPWNYGFGPISWESATANAWKNVLGQGWHR